MTENTRLKDAAQQLRMVEANLARLEAETEAAIEARRKLEREILPDLMHEAGIKSFTLADGSVLKLTVLAEGSLPKEPTARAAAIEWLVANGYQDLIENKVTSSWSRGERAAAVDEYQRLAARGDAKVTLDEGIHFKVLGARMRDRVVAGQPTPLEALGISVFQRARFTKTTSNGQ